MVRDINGAWSGMVYRLAPVVPSISRQATVARDARHDRLFAERSRSIHAPA